MAYRNVEITDNAISELVHMSTEMAGFSRDGLCLHFAFISTWSSPTLGSLELGFQVYLLQEIASLSKFEILCSFRRDTEVTGCRSKRVNTPLAVLRSNSY